MGVIGVGSLNREPDSPFADGAVIQQHGFRPSEDLDTFAVSSKCLDELVQAGRSALVAAGHSVRPGRSHDGFRECVVMKSLIGTTTLQWTHGLASEFCFPLSDPMFGHRLHFAALGVNKALAAAGRMEVRDFVDLWMLDRKVELNCYRRLEVDDAGQPVVSREFKPPGICKAPGPGGALPAFVGMDSGMIAGLIGEYGPEGNQYRGPSPPSSGSGSGTTRSACSGSSSPRENPDQYKPTLPWDDWANRRFNLIGI